MQTPYYSVEQMIGMIPEPNHSILKRILADNIELFKKTPGSKTKHQAWAGGYLDHVQEIMNISIVLYEKLNSLRPLPFLLSDALLVTFLHDIEKPWKYEAAPDGSLKYIESLNTKLAQREFRDKKLKEYGVELTPDQYNAMKYVEGENDDYNSEERVMGPLATLCHLADITSGRIWFDHPFENDDPWKGAGRFRN